MTNSPVKGVAAPADFFTAKAKAANLSNGNFGDVFGKTYGQTQQQKLELQNDSRINLPQAKTEINTSQKPAQPVRDISKPATKDAVSTEKQQDEVTQAGEDLVKDVAEELGISVEEVEKAMEALGIGPMDLLNADVMTELFMTLADTDMLTMLTNDGQYQSLQNLLGKAQESLTNLQNSLSLTPSEMDAVLVQVRELAAGQAPETLPEQDMKQSMPETPDEMKPSENTGNVEVEMADEAAIMPKNSGAEGADESLTTKGKQNGGDLQVDQVKEDGHRDTSGESASQKENSSQGSRTQIDTFMNQPIRNDSQINGAAAFDEAMAARNVNTRDVVNQIMDYMRVQVKADMTQMQIQLHPASLGTININITSKDGLISAQFLAQNEAVKSAIESQIVQLKSSFEEQGIKVQAVEVTVESHSFDRSPSQSESGQKQKADDHSKKSGGRRVNLNLNELSAEEEAGLEESEQIAVEMMNVNGNTVDYTA